MLYATAPGTAAFVHAIVDFDCASFAHTVVDFNGVSFIRAVVDLGTATLIHAIVYFDRLAVRVCVSHFAEKRVQGGR